MTNWPHFQKSCPLAPIIYSRFTMPRHKLDMTPSLPKSRVAFLSADELVLDVAARTLTGPAGSCELAVSVFAILRALMQNHGAVLEVGQLIEARWCSNLEPMNARTIVRMAVKSARDAIEQVGADPKQLRAITAVGYRLDGPPRIVRAYTREQATTLDHILATHPDRQLVSCFVSAVHCPSNEPAFSGPANLIVERAAA